MTKVYVQREKGKVGKIVTVMSLRAGKVAGLSEVLDDSDPEVQTFFNPKDASEADILANSLKNDVVLNKLCKALAKRFGVSESEMINEIIKA